MIKSTLIGLISAVALIPAVNAADVYSREGGYKDGPANYAPASTWTGFYIGVNGGGILDDKGSSYNYYGRDNETLQAAARLNNYSYTSTNNSLSDEFLGGVQIGYNWQHGSIVYGLEGDVDFGDKIDYLASIRGRLGVAFDGWLLYATGGVAFLGFNDDYSVNNGYNSWSYKNDETQTGFVVGAGIERKFGRNWSFGVEGLYYSFDDDKKSGNLYNDNEKFVVSYDRDRDLDFWSVRGRISYHFTADEYATPLK